MSCNANQRTARNVLAELSHPKIHAAIVLLSRTRSLCDLTVGPNLRHAINIWFSRSQVLDVRAFEPAFQRAGTDLRGTSLARLNRTSFSLQTHKAEEKQPCEEH